MKKADKKIENAFLNRAKVESSEEIACDNCYEHVVFLLKDKDHEFSVGLTTVLECLMFAIKNGNLPKLPKNWVRLVDGYYDTEFALDEELCYYGDNNFVEKE